MTRQPTRTTNRIHLTDLDPRRFEDLCLAIVYALCRWSDVRHYGRSGSDGGVDILGSEVLENGTRRGWVVQCKRVKAATAADLKSAIDEVLTSEHSRPDVLLVILACDVSRKAHEAFIRYARSKGIAHSQLWTQSVIEAKLVNERPDLLFAYFGISMAAETRSREMTISRNIGLKKRLRRELRNPEARSAEVLKRPDSQFRVNEAIIRSVDDSSYPRVEDLACGISSWFKVELYNYYFNGLECVLRAVRTGITADGGWRIFGHDEELDRAVFREANTLLLGRIPFRNIVDFDPDGDEFYAMPHLFCLFADSGTPYEGFRPVLLGGTYPVSLDPEKEIRR